MAALPPLSHNTQHQLVECLPLEKSTSSKVPAPQASLSSGPSLNGRVTKPTEHANFVNPLFQSDALPHAAEKGCLSAVKRILAEHYEALDISVIRESLQNAARNGHSHVVNWLLQTHIVLFPEIERIKALIALNEHAVEQNAKPKKDDCILL